MTPDEVITVVKDSGLRGRGGAGFPTGMKWSSSRSQADGKPHYLVVNADEGEPGTCKDAAADDGRPALAHRGHRHRRRTRCAANSRSSTCAARLVHAHRRLQHAIQEAYDAGYLGTDILGTGFDLELVVHAGAGAYICGEETALLDSLEGYRGQPRLKPPFPATAGLYAVADGGQQRRDAGQRAVRSSGAAPTGSRRWARRSSPGPKIYSLSGRIVAARASTRRRWARRCASCWRWPAASGPGTS